MSSQPSLSLADVPVPRIVEWIDKFILGFGRCVSWLSLALIASILLQVILRYAFDSGLVMLEELQWHLYAIIVMNAVSFGVTEDIHVRMDLLYQKHSDRTKVWINIFGLMFFLLPLTFVLFIKGVDMVQASYAVGESSVAPAGLPFRWLIKSLLPFSMALYALAAISRIIRSFAFLFRKEGN
jgi:TRAP-type mannitol/chloroaromatic compound transport system permease small subunit